MPQMSFAMLRQLRWLRRLRRWFTVVLCALVLMAGIGQAGQAVHAHASENDALYAELATRPLNVPTVGAGDACPHSAVGPIAVERIGSSLGGGPVFLTLGHDGVAQFHSYDKSDGLYTTRIIWAVAPDIRSPVLVRGQQINGPNIVRFAYDGPATLDALRFGAAPDVPLIEAEDEWRFAAASLGVAGPGCYVLQADGPYFSESVVFAVAVA